MPNFPTSRLLCGHRGHSAGAPENTLAALKAAALFGARCCEIDVQLTADDHPVLLHDMTLDRTTNDSGAVGELRLEQIRTLDAGAWFGDAFAGEPLPSLEDVLNWARGKLRLLIELKEFRRPAWLVERLAVMLKDRDPMDVILLSFDHRQLLDIKQLLPQVQTEALVTGRPADVVAVARAAGANWIALDAPNFDPEDAWALHRANIAVRVHLPLPHELGLYGARGAALERRVVSWYAEGLIDVLSGDDVAHLTALTTPALVAVRE